MPEGIHRQQTKQRRRLGHRRGARAADALVLTNMLLVLAVRSGVRRVGMAVLRAAHAACPSSLSTVFAVATCGTGMAVRAARAGRS